MYKVAVLAGGLATRIKPISTSLPKSLVPINGTPFIDLQLSLLSNAGFKEVVVLLGYLGEQIENYVGDGKKYDLSISYSYDGGQLLGTGGAIVRALPSLGDAFCVIYGDSYLRMDFMAAANKFQQSEKLGLMAIYRNINKSYQNNVLFDGNSIVGFSKANPPPMANYIDYGFSIFRREVFESHSASKRFDLSFVCEELARIGQIEAYESPETFYEIGSFEGIKDLELKLKDKYR